MKRGAGGAGKEPGGQQEKTLGKGSRRRDPPGAPGGCPPGRMRTEPRALRSGTGPGGGPGGARAGAAAAAAGVGAAVRGAEAGEERGRRGGGSSAATLPRFGGLGGLPGGCGAGMEEPGLGW